MIKAPIESKTISNTISGFTDYTEEEHILFKQWKDKVSNVYAKYGFISFESRPVEYTHQLCKEGGINKQIFTIGQLSTGQITDLALPFDRTVPLALWINRHAKTIFFPLKRQDVDLSWRGEHAQLGRFRAFYQADVDMIGKNLGLQADAECIVTIFEALREIQMDNCRMYLNHMNLSKVLIESLGATSEQTPELLRIVDKMEKIDKEEMVKEISLILPNLPEEEISSFYDLISYKGPLNEFPFEKVPQTEKSQGAWKQLEHLFSLLDLQEIPQEKLFFCPSMVRGLDYYTGIVFETYHNDIPGGGSIASGGRYDQLVESVTDDPCEEVKGLQGVGGSIGLTRLFALAVANQLVKPEKKDHSFVYVCTRFDKKNPEKNEEFLSTLIKISKELRKLGIAVSSEVSSEEAFHKKLRFAERKGYPHVIAIMETDAFLIKDMKERKDCEVRTKEEAIESLKNSFSLSL